MSERQEFAAWREQLRNGVACPPIVTLKALDALEQALERERVVRKALTEALGAEADALERERQLREAIQPLMGTLNYYIGPAARTAVSREDRVAYERLRAALEDGL